MTNREAHVQLERLKEWVQEKLDAGAEPPFAWYEYMKWREATEAILRGFAMTIPLKTPPVGDLKVMK